MILATSKDTLLMNMLQVNATLTKKPQLVSTKQAKGFEQTTTSPGDKGNWLLAGTCFQKPFRQVFGRTNTCSLEQLLTPWLDLMTLHSSTDLRLQTVREEAGQGLCSKVPKHQPGHP